MARHIEIVDHGGVFSCGTPDQLKDRARGNVIEVRPHFAGRLAAVQGVLARVGSEAQNTDIDTQLFSARVTIVTSNRSQASAASSAHDAGHRSTPARFGSAPAAPRRTLNPKTAHKLAPGTPTGSGAITDAQEVAMQYALAIHVEPGGDQELSGPDRDEVIAEYQALLNDPRRLQAAQLEPVEMATTVRVVGGPTLITDGPFADTKEVLGGLC